MKKGDWKMKKFIFFIFSMFCLQLVQAEVMEIRMVDSDHNTITLEFDKTTYSYVDGTIKNPNEYVYLVSDNPENDLQDKYALLSYQVGDKAIPISTSLAKMAGTRHSARLDLDLSMDKAVYPGILSMAASNTNNFNPQDTVYYQLTETTGLLEGSYNVAANYNNKNVVVRIEKVIDGGGNDISTDKSYIIVGIKKVSSSAVYDTEISSPGKEVSLAKPGEDFEFVINGILVSDYALDGSISVPEEAEVPSSSGSGGSKGMWIKKLFGIDDEEIEGDNDYLEVWDYEKVPDRVVEVPSDEAIQKGSGVKTGSTKGMEKILKLPINISSEISKHPFLFLGSLIVLGLLIAGIVLIRKFVLKKGVKRNDVI